MTWGIGQRIILEEPKATEGRELELDKKVDVKKALNVICQELSLLIHIGNEGLSPLIIFSGTDTENLYSYMSCSHNDIARHYLKDHYAGNIYLEKDQEMGGFKDAPYLTDYFGMLLTPEVAELYDQKEPVIRARLELLLE